MGKLYSYLHNFFLSLLLLIRLFLNNTELKNIWSPPGIEGGPLNAQALCHGATTTSCLVMAKFMEDMSIYGQIDDCSIVIDCSVPSISLIVAILN